MSNEPRRVYWIDVLPRRVIVMTGIATRYGRGWSARPKYGPDRYVAKAYDSSTKARTAALEYCSKQVMNWQKQARRFKVL